MTLEEARNLIAAERLLMAGYPDYAETILAAGCGRPGQTILRLIKAGGPVIAAQRAREMARPVLDAEETRVRAQEDGAWGAGDQPTQQETAA